MWTRSKLFEFFKRRWKTHTMQCWCCNKAVPLYLTCRLVSHRQQFWWKGGETGTKKLKTHLFEWVNLGYFPWLLSLFKNLYVIFFKKSLNRIYWHITNDSSSGRCHVSCACDPDRNNNGYIKLIANFCFAACRPNLRQGREPVVVFTKSRRLGPLCGSELLRSRPFRTTKSMPSTRLQPPPPKTNGTNWRFSLIGASRQWMISH